MTIFKNFECGDPGKQARWLSELRVRLDDIIDVAAKRLQDTNENPKEEEKQMKKKMVLHLVIDSGPECYIRYSHVEIDVSEVASEKPIYLKKGGVPDVHVAWLELKEVNG